MNPTIIIDTREQLPYAFPDDWQCLRQALPTGDYTLLGFQDSFLIERKSLNDLLGCLFTPRFKRELERLRQVQHSFLVVEASLWKIHHHCEGPLYKGSANSVMGMLQAIPLRYGVQTLFLDDRSFAQQYVKGLLQKYQKYLAEGRLYSFVN